MSIMLNIPKNNVDVLSHDIFLYEETSQNANDPVPGVMRSKAKQPNLKSFL